MAPLTRSRARAVAAGKHRQQLIYDTTFAQAKISRQWPVQRGVRLAKAVPRGMRNRMFQCYRRSVMQMLLNTPIWLNWVRQHRGRTRKERTPNCPQHEGCMACHFFHLSKLYWKPGAEDAFAEAVEHFDGAYVNLEWSIDWPDFDIDAQQDADEFLQFLIGKLVAEPFDNKPMSTALQRAMFLLQTRHSWTCPKCGTPAPDVPDQSFVRQISMIHARGRDVQQYLDDSFVPSRVDTTCGACGRKVMAERGERVVAAPQLLLLKLGAFNNAGQKLRCQPQLLDELSLDHLVAPPHHEGGQGLQYRLRSVVHHNGATPYEGHYRAAVDTPSGSWMTNDERIRTMPGITAVLTEKVTLPYILMYERLE